MMIFCSPSISQEILVKGQVLDNKGVSIRGVSVFSVKGKKGVTTDINGDFTLTADSTDFLNVSAVGFKTITLAVRSIMQITLQVNEEELDQIVLVGNREGGRVKTETPVPVDVIRLN
jgi:iron complex outermembrane receptor protein